MTHVQPSRQTLQLQAFVDALPDMAFLLDAAGNVVFGNKTCSRILGWDDSHLGASALAFVHPDDVPVVATSMTTILDKPSGSPIEFRVRDRAGEWRWVELIGGDFLATPGLNGFVCVARDITQRKRWDLAGNDLARFEHALQHGAGLTFLLAPDGTITGVNHALNRLLGYDKSRVVGQPLDRFVAPASSDSVKAAIAYVASTEQSCAVEVTMPHAEPSRGSFLLRFELRSLSTEGGLVANGQDITELDDVRRRLRHLADHDPLTGLANRTLLRRTIDQRLVAGTEFVVVFLDLDGFKAVNDRFGHRFGDQVLEAFGGRLAEGLRPHDLVARVGGDEFVVVADIDARSTPAVIAQRLRVVSEEPFVTPEGPVAMNASLGYALSRPRATPDTLIDDADAAMYADKRRQLANAPSEP
jgi:diguanylate cyclase (GGDEF)-like protein/PAS domain S-box-containing protein